MVLDIFLPLESAAIASFLWFDLRLISEILSKGRILVQGGEFTLHVEDSAGV